MSGARAPGAEPVTSAQAAEASLPSADDSRWCLIRSELLGGEHIVLVFDQADLVAAREAFPGIVVYLPQEVAELELRLAGDGREVGDEERVGESVGDRGCARSDALVRFAHGVKKVFAGWIVPSTPSKSERVRLWEDLHAEAERRQSEREEESDG